MKQLHKVRLLLGFCLLLAALMALAVACGGEEKEAPTSPTPQATQTSPTLQATATPVATTKATPTPTLAATPKATPTSEVSYEVVRDRDVSSPARKRRQLDVLIAEGATKDQTVTTLAQAARFALESHKDYDVVAVFAYFEASQVGKGYTKGRSVLSRDKKGWAGDGKMLGSQQDTGKIEIDVVIAGTTVQSEFIPTKEEHVSISR